MIVGVGIDLVNPERVGRALEEHGGRFEERVFTAGERADCNERADRVLAFAARFAAKEACLKALGTGWSEGLAFSEVEVVRDERGAPSLRLTGAAAARARELGVRETHVSLSHERSMAAAVVVLES